MTVMKYFFILWVVQMASTLHYLYRSESIDSDWVCALNGLSQKIELHKNRQEALYIYLNSSKHHPIDWTINHHCVLKVSASSGYGMMVVIQNLDLRKDSSGNCLDYVEFATKHQRPVRFCGKWDVFRDGISGGNDTLPFTFTTDRSKVETTIHIARQRLATNEESEINIVYTMFKRGCSSSKFRCLPDMEDFCIDMMFKNDAVVNCAFAGFREEDGGIWLKNANRPRIELGLMAGIIIILFVTFCISVYIFKKTRCLCWAENFSLLPGSRRQASGTPERRPAHEGAAAAPSAVVSSTVPTAPAEDAPPTYDALFPHIK